MQVINRLNITWTDNHTARVQDPDNGHEFNITVQPKTNTFVGGNAVKSRLYIGGDILVKKEDELGRRKAIAWAREHFGYTLNKIINRSVDLKFSWKAGCSCGCSPGFIIQDDSIPFDIWMEAK